MKRYTLFLLLAGLWRLSLTTAAETDSLNHYLHMAAEHNPGVRADFLAYRAALQRLPQAGAYQDPQLEMGFFLQPMDIVDGRQVADIRLMQMFPWFGTRKAARTEAQHMAQMAFAQFRETRDRLFLDVSVQWFTLCRLQRQLANSRENRELLLRLEEPALQRFASPPASKGAEPSARQSAPPPSPTLPSGAGGMGGMNMNDAASAASGSTPATMGGMSGMDGMGGSAAAGMADVLRLRMEIVEADNRIESLLSEIRAAKAAFNLMLNRPVDSEIRLPDLPEQTSFLLDSASVRMQMTARNPMLEMVAEEELAYKAKADMDRRMSYPMFGIGLQYMLIRKKATAAPAMDDGMGADMGGMNGKDMIMPMLSVTIPIYRSKYNARQRENALLQQAGREKYRNTQNMLEAELVRLNHLLDDAARRIALYRRQTELAQATCNLAVQEFASGRGDLAGVIRVQRQLLDYALKASEAVADYHIAAANIRKLISSHEE
ncbi:MAG: TolC family protein [Tannerella sp.]|jgi:outer membrane protein TolC|nr:TolC family protein [Tannerella sp.]